jgi:proline racemase
VGALDAIVPEVTGRAFITGRHTFWVDPADPLREGFLLR